MGFTLVYVQVLFLKLRTCPPELPAVTGTTAFYQEQTFLEGEEEDGQREGHNTYKCIVRPGVVVSFPLPYAFAPITNKIAGDSEQQLTTLGSANHGRQSVTRIT